MQKPLAIAPANFKPLQALMGLALASLMACGDIGLSVGPTGTGDANPTTTGSTTSASTTSGSTTSSATTSGSTTSGSTTSGTTTSGSTTSGSTTSGSTTGTSACTTSTDTYASWGQSFINTNCIACHNGAGPDLSTQAAIAAVQTTAVSQIQSAMMPVGATLSSADKTRAVNWLSCNPLP